MKIMFAAPFSGVRASIFISNYYRSLERQAFQQGHETRLFDTQEAIAMSDVPKWARKLYRPISGIVDALHLLSIFERKHSEAFAQELARFCPDILFVYVIQSRCLTHVIRDARSKGVTTVMWVGLNPNVISQGAKEALSEIDCIFTYDESYVEGFRALGCRYVKVIPLGINVEVYDSVIPSDHGKNIAFLGMLEETRIQYLNAIHDLGLGIWSWNFDTGRAQILEECYCGEASGNEAIAALKAARIGINIHRDFEISGGNFRLFEIPSCKALQLVDYRKGIEKYFVPGEEIVFFENIKDLREKVAYFLSHEEERLKIALNGWERVKKDHHISERFKQMMHCLKNLGISRA